MPYLKLGLTVLNVSMCAMQAAQTTRVQTLFEREAGIVPAKI